MSTKKFVVVEFAHIRATHSCDVQEFDCRDAATEYLNELVSEFRTAEMRLDDESGPVIHQPCPNPYRFDQKRAAALYEAKDPEWQSAMGKF